MQETEKIEEITEKVKSYIQTNYELIKLQTIERSSVILADLISNILVGLVVILFVFFLSICAGFYFSSRLGEYYLGFAIVAGFYFLCGLILILLRKKLLERPMRDKIIRMIFRT